MGRTNPTYRRALDSLVQEYQPFRRALRHPHDEDFDAVVEKARSFADAATHQNPPRPAHGALVSVLVAQEAELRECRAAVEELRTAVQELRETGDERHPERQDDPTPAVESTADTG